MRLIHFAGLLSAAFSSLALALNRATEAIAGFFAAALALFKPEPLAFAAGTPALALDIPGNPLDRSLLHDLRHEAGVSRRSAARKQ